MGWRPYSFEDYRQRGFDPKAVPGGKYWALGGLDPARPPSDATWQAQQIKRDRQQQFGEAVSPGVGGGGASWFRVNTCC